MIDGVGSEGDLSLVKFDSPEDRCHTIQPEVRQSRQSRKKLDIALKKKFRQLTQKSDSPNGCQIFHRELR